LAFRRGFKSWCEQTALTVRRELGLSESAVLPARTLADHLGVTVWSIQDIPGLPDDTLRMLTSTLGDEWSAVSLIDANEHFIVHNSAHSRARQTSNITHELAHNLLEHDASPVLLVDDQEKILRPHDKQQEDEAAWLTGTLLVPRPAALEINRTKTSKAIMAERYGVSIRLLEYRLNVTGVKYQTRQTNRTR